MGIFDSITKAIFGEAKAAPAPSGASPTTAAASTPPGSSAASAPAQTVDVAPILDKAAKDSGEHLSWRTSIVDLMKALKLDSSLSARKELAKELGYTGDMGDSATMNVWLHKAVIKKLSENGGKVPADLLD